LFGEDGNDDLEGGPDNDNLDDDAGRNVYSGRGGADCINVSPPPIASGAP
jgi:Ca2+-binding RTX toxin-like protein